MYLLETIMSYRSLVKVGDLGTAGLDFEQFLILVIPSATNTENSGVCTDAYAAPKLLERNPRPSI